MPPNYVARVGSLQTFALPESVTGTARDQQMGKDLIAAWRRDGILQVSMDSTQHNLAKAAFSTSKGFFQRPHNGKASYVDPQSYSGYIASGEEITDGIADYSEIFTVTKDLPQSDMRVRNGWPCHGPCPWPDADMKRITQRYMDSLGESAEKILQLTAHGLELENQNSITRYTQDGWHHLRILRQLVTGFWWP